MDDTKPLALLLDVDDTLLKEVSAVDYKNSSNVQSLTYKPSDSVFLKYKSISDSGSVPKGKTIHYELDDHQKTIISYVALRPCFIQIIKNLLGNNSCLFYLFSANDPPRTEAICAQIKVDGKTLAEYGFQVIPREVFMSGDTSCKDIGLIRKWTKMTDLVLAIIVDDKPHDLLNISRSDHVVGVSPFNKEAVEMYLETGTVSDDVAISEQIQAAMHSLPEFGVSLAFLRQFLKLHITDSDNASYTTNEVCQNIVKPKCVGVEGDPSYVTLLSNGTIDDFPSDARYVGPASHFTSHAWSYKFSEMVDALECDVGEFDEDGNVNFFWLDIFVVPQTRRVLPPQAWWSTAFFRAISVEKCFVLICFEWYAPRCIKRCWCLWEVYAALRMGKKLADNSLLIALPREQELAFRSRLLEDVYEVQKCILQVDAMNADAWNVEDKNMIFSAIKQHTFDGVEGFDGINAVVKALMRSWVNKTGAKLLEEMEESGTTGSDVAGMASLQHAIALTAHQQGDYVRSVKLYRNAVKNRTDALGEANELTVDSLHRLALSLRKNPDDREEAKGVLQRVMDLATNNTQRLRARKVLAELMIETDDAAKGVVALRVCVNDFALNDRALEISKKNPQCRQLFHCEQLLGNGLRVLASNGDCIDAATKESYLHEALKLQRAAAADWSLLDGENHDNALSAKCDLAVTLASAGECNDAIHLLEEVTRIRTREQGADHIKTKRASEMLEKFLEIENEIKKSQMLNVPCLD